jgi:hypothetical protein
MKIGFQGLGVSLLALAGIIATPLSSYAQDSNEGTVSGFAEVRGITQVGAKGEPFQGIERVRSSFDAPLGERVSLVTTVEAELTQGRDLQTEFERLFNESPIVTDGWFDLLECSWPDPHANTTLQIDDARDYLRLDRFYLDVYLPGIDLRIGRQAVQWGSAQMINPTDPFPEVLFTTPWRFRQGVNSVRATIPFKAHQVQLFLGTSDLFDATRAATRATFNALQTDWSVVAAYRGETGERMVGADIRGTLGVGYWIEAAVHMPTDDVPTTRWRSDEVEACGSGCVWEEVAIGVDYSFPVLDLFVVGAQYYRNGSGLPNLSGIGLGGPVGGALQVPTCDNSSSVSFMETPTVVDPYRPFTSGRDYVILNTKLTFIPELSTSLVALQNLGDGSGYFIPQLTTLPTGWLEIAVVGQVPYQLWGDYGEFRPNPNDLIIGEPDAGLEVDLNGLLADATVVLWARVNF